MQREEIIRLWNVKFQQSPNHSARQYAQSLVLANLGYENTTLHDAYEKLKGELDYHVSLLTDIVRARRFEEVGWYTDVVEVLAAGCLQVWRALHSGDEGTYSLEQAIRDAEQAID